MATSPSGNLSATSLSRPLTLRPVVAGETVHGTLFLTRASLKGLGWNHERTRQSFSQILLSQFAPATGRMFMHRNLAKQWFEGRLLPCAQSAVRCESDGCKKSNRQFARIVGAALIADQVLSRQATSWPKAKLPLRTVGLSPSNSSPLAKGVSSTNSTSQSRWYPELPELEYSRNAHAERWKLTTLCSVDRSVDETYIGVLRRTSMK